MLFITDLLYYEFDSSFMSNKHPEYEHHHMNNWMSGIAHMDLTDYGIICENTVYELPVTKLNVLIASERNH